MCSKITSVVIKESVEIIFFSLMSIRDVEFAFIELYRNKIFKNPHVGFKRNPLNFMGTRLLLLSMMDMDYILRHITLVMTL